MIERLLIILVVFVVSFQFVPATCEPFTATGDMMTTRYGHAETLLPNGKVLITGGQGGTNTAELYDPATGTFSYTGNMTSNRHVHTATLLLNGKVLLAGGYGSTDLNTAELYDPANGTFSATGNMTSARQRHTATLLPSGKVLITGGYYNSGGYQYLNTAELYDPVSGTFSAVGNMTYSRSQHVATLLLDGSVLVTGGFAGGVNYTNTAELYSPADNAFSATGNMTLARNWHTSTLLPGGKVLITGGYYSDGTYHYLDNADLYDPVSGLFGAVGTMVSARGFHKATLLPDGTMLLTGGITDASSTTLNTAELYNPANSDLFGSVENMTTARYWHTATAMYNCTILVSGGRYYDGTWHPVKSADLYTPDPATCGNPLFKIGLAVDSYPTIQDAYEALTEGETLQIQALIFTGGLLTDQDRTVTLQGGYWSDFTLNPLYATISDNLTVNRGTVTVENLIIK